MRCPGPPAPFPLAAGVLVKLKRFCEAVGRPIPLALSQAVGLSPLLGTGDRIPSWVQGPLPALAVQPLPPQVVDVLTAVAVALAVLLLDARKVAKNDNVVCVES